MRIAFGARKPTNPHSKYVILIDFPLHNICTSVPECYVMCTFSVFSHLRLGLPSGPLL